MFKHIIQGLTEGDKVRWRCSNCMALNESNSGLPYEHRCDECGDVSNVMP